MGILYALIGVSGAGKTTIGRKTFGKNRELISTTTRPIREGETDGVDYYFVTKEEFTEKFNNNEFAEHDYYDGNYYGLSIQEIKDKTKNGDAYVVITKHGYDQVKRIYSHILPVFIYADRQDTRSFLKKRGESEESIQKRMNLYDRDMKNQDQCAFSIKNKRNELENTVKFFKIIVRIIKQKKMEELFNVK